MRFCLHCRTFSGGGPLCTGCGRSFGGRLCRGKTRHLNPHDARFCNFCGTRDLEEGTTSVPLGWVSRVLLVALLVSGGRWLLLHFSGAPDLSMQGLTGYQNGGVWLVEKFGHIFTILFVFYFLSAFVPGEAGKQFRGAMSSLVLHTIKFSFKVLEGAVRLAGALLLKAAGTEWKTKKKK